MGLNESHFYVVMDYLARSLQQVGCSPEDASALLDRVMEWKGALLSTYLARNVTLKCCVGRLHSVPGRVGLTVMCTNGACACAQT